MLDYDGNEIDEKGLEEIRAENKFMEDNGYCENVCPICDRELPKNEYGDYESVTCACGYYNCYGVDEYYLYPNKKNDCYDINRTTNEVRKENGLEELKEFVYNAPIDELIDKASYDSSAANDELMKDELMEMKQKALEIATKAHDGQVDKAGNPYINHPLAVAEKMATVEEKIVALLHDVVEDSDITMDDLREEGFSEEILLAIDSITKRKSESEGYSEYIERLKMNPLAVRVKLADLEHNSDISRIENPTQADYDRVENYKLKIEELENI